MNKTYKYWNWHTNIGIVIEISDSHTQYSVKFALRIWQEPPNVCVRDMLTVNFVPPKVTIVTYWMRYVKVWQTILSNMVNAFIILNKRCTLLSCINIDCYHSWFSFCYTSWSSFLPLRVGAGCHSCQSALVGGLNLSRRPACQILKDSQGHQNPGVIL